MHSRLNQIFEGLLALGQQQFEMAKLHWSCILSKKEDISKWDPTEIIELFDSAEEKMKVATVMWEKLEEKRAKKIQVRGLKRWIKNLDEVVERFKLAGSSETDISLVLKNLAPMVMLLKETRRRLGT
ncbi:hypothetical protein ACSBR1_015336 [Camellia fascicularis]